MSQDALSLLRACGTAGDAVVIDGTEAVFGDQRLPLDTETRYLAKGKDTGYPLIALALLLQLQDKPPSEYFKACTQRGVRTFVTTADRSAVLGYLTGRFSESEIACFEPPAEHVAEYNLPSHDLDTGVKQLAVAQVA